MHRTTVDSSCRGLGIGKKLVKGLEDTARQNGYKHLYLETATPQIVAIKMYQMCGYKFVRSMNLQPESTAINLGGFFEMISGIKVVAYSKSLDD